MTPATFKKSLEEFQRTPDPIRRALLADQLQKVPTTCAWIDAEHLRELEHALRTHGVPFRAELAVRPPGVGESLLLLYDRAVRRGVVNRLTLTTAAAGAALSPDARSELDRVRRGMLGALGRLCRSLPDDVLGMSLATALGRDVAIDGGSFGLSLCVALVSQALGRAPASDAACSAAVSSDGFLRKVDDVAAKLEALQRQWPTVRRLVVAVEQPPLDAPAGIEVIRVSTIAEGLEAFGLPLAQLRASLFDDHLARVARFRRDNQGALPASEWHRLGWQAVESAEVLSSEPTTSREATSSRAWAALFFLHAGDTGLAEAQLRSVSDEAADETGNLAWKRVIEAAAKIDLDPAAAVALSRAALELARGDDKLLGQALGTHGRALMHAGLPQDAEPLLREAVTHHERVAAAEVPRSRAYLATCLRRLGRLDDALACAEVALEQAGNLAQKWLVARSSLGFLELERGRCLAELGRHVDALVAFQRVVEACRFDHDYPCSAALRGLANSHRALGASASAEDLLRRCVKVARENSTILGQVAAMAIADVLAAPVPITTSIPPDDLLAAWRNVFPAATTPAELRSVRERFVY